MIEVRAVETKHDWRRFCEVPRRIYRNDPNWLPLLDADVTPALRTPSSEVARRMTTQCYTAFIDGKAIGRIAGIVDQAYNDYHQRRAAAFGFYEAINDPGVAASLLDAVAAWARRRGLDALVGPFNPTMLSGAGFAIAGEPRPALVGMPYNPDYYCQHMTQWGMRKSKDLHSFYSSDPASKAAELERRWSKRIERSRVRLRTVDSRNFERETETLRELYNAAFTGFWGFVPASRDEFLEITTSFRAIFDEELALFATIDDKPVGYLMAIPDVNQACARAARWRNPLARNLSLLWHWHGPGRKSTVRQVRVDMFLAHPRCPDAAAPALLMFELLKRIRDKGYSGMEAAPMLDDVSWWPALRRCLFTEPCRVYRVYERALA